MYLGLPLLCHECAAGFDGVGLLKLVMRDARARITPGGEEEKEKERKGCQPPVVHPHPVRRLRLQQARRGSSSPANPRGASADKATAIEQRRSDGSVIKSLTPPPYLPRLRSSLSLSLASTTLHPSPTRVAHHHTTQHNTTSPSIALTVIVLNLTNRNHEGRTLRRSVAAGLSERRRP